MESRKEKNNHVQAEGLELQDPLGGFLRRLLHAVGVSVAVAHEPDREKDAKLVISKSINSGASFKITNSRGLSPNCRGS